MSVLSVDDMAAADPDVILFTLCGFDLQRSAQELRATQALTSPGLAKPLWCHEHRKCI